MHIEQEAWNTFQKLPLEKQAEAIDFIEFLKSKLPQQSQQKLEKRPFGVLKGKIWMSDDFDAPLEIFQE